MNHYKFIPVLALTFALHSCDFLKGKDRATTPISERIHVAGSAKQSQGHVSGKGNRSSQSSSSSKTSSSSSSSSSSSGKNAPSSSSGSTELAIASGRLTNLSQQAALELVRCAPLKNRPEQLLVRKAYVASFNSKTLMPNWVGWRLTKAHASGTIKRDGVPFMPDNDVDEAYRVTTYDYQRSGYDRGHMCPAADNQWSMEAMEQCFLMTNMCPQNHSLNAGDWNEMEQQCRKWAQRFGEVYIVSGPIVYKKSKTRIGQHHKVTVPDAFFKVVACFKGSPKGIGFIYKNDAGNKQKADYVNTIDQVERITGLDFFPALPDDVERQVESKASLEDWGL